MMHCNVFSCCFKGLNRIKAMKQLKISEIISVQIFGKNGLILLYLKFFQ